MPKPGAEMLRTFIEELGAAVGRGHAEGRTVAAVKGIVTGALEARGWIPERCLRQAPDCYARHLLYKDPDDRFAIVVMVWGSAQKTPIHDHGGVWCVEGVYQGRIRVRRYDMEGATESGVVRFQAGEVIEAGKGQTGALIPPVEHHSIENPTDQTSITIHTYGCDLKSCQIYVPRPDGTYDVCTKDLRYNSVPEAVSGAAVGLI